MKWGKKIYKIKNNIVIPYSFIKKYVSNYAFYLNELSYKPERIHCDEEFYNTMNEALEIIIIECKHDIEMCMEIIRKNNIVSETKSYYDKKR